MCTSLCETVHFYAGTIFSWCELEDRWAGWFFYWDWRVNICRDITSQGSRTWAAAEGTSTLLHKSAQVKSIPQVKICQNYTLQNPQRIFKHPEANFLQRKGTPTESSSETCTGKPDIPSVHGWVARIESMLNWFERCPPKSHPWTEKVTQSWESFIWFYLNLELTT